MDKRKILAENILVSKYNEQIITSECWDIELIISCDTCEDLSTVAVDGLLLSDWLRTLFGQKLLATEETSYTSHFTNILYMKQLDDEYVKEVIQLILNSKMPHLIIDFIELTKK